MQSVRFSLSLSLSLVLQGILQFLTGYVHIFQDKYLTCQKRALNLLFHVYILYILGLNPLFLHGLHVQEGRESQKREKQLTSQKRH